MSLPFHRDWIQPVLSRWSELGIHIGTSSWKYPGWMGSLYSEQAYLHHGHFSKARFDRTCLTEYAQVFRTVGVDAAYYAFPSATTWSGWTRQVPAGFLFSPKVTDEITLRHYPRVPRRFGTKAGQRNPHFLDAHLFQTRYLDVLEAFRPWIGLILFEFTRFTSEDYDRGRHFVEDLDRFLSQLPRNWRYGVELRNRSFLHPDYFATLSRHGVTHIFNSWEEMPSVTGQMAFHGSVTTPDLLAFRLLLRPGRSYAEAVRRFDPYSHVQDPYPELRQDMAEVLAQSLRLNGQRRTFIYVNNRLEGHALGTISAMVALARSLSERISNREQDGP
jgi:uncharacterized protein YecE (DUF72 family)